MPKKENTKKTPSRRKLGTGTPVGLTVSPYFPPTPSNNNALGIKRKHEEDEDTKPTVARSTPNRVSSVKREMRLTTSPYFSQPGTNTPPPRTQPATPKSEFDSEGEKEEERKEEKRREGKRRRLVVRGDTPDEPPPPPATPRELAEALRRVGPKLVQERVRDDPWKIVVSSTLLNKTTGRAAVPIFWELIKLYPTPISLAQAAAPIITTLLRPLGIQSLRTSRLIRFSNAYVMHPPALQRTKGASDVATGLPLDDELPTVSSSQSSTSAIQTPEKHSHPHPRSFLVSSQTRRTPQPKPALPSPISPKQYLKTQKQSPIAHLPLTGPYAIDSFRIFSSALPGGGAPAGVAAQLRRVAQLPESAEDEDAGWRDDFDETPGWYDPALLRVSEDEEGDEWRKVRPADKELRRYLVWRWAIEGIAYEPEAQTFKPASWIYLINLIRQ